MALSTQLSEAPRPVVLTPERIADLLGRPIAEVEAALQNVQEREVLAHQLSNQAEVQRDFNGDLHRLNAHLNAVGETLGQKKTFFEKMKGAAGWTLEKLWSVITYPARHPIQTVIFAALVYFGAPYVYKLLAGAEGAASATGLDWISRLFEARSKLGSAMPPGLTPTPGIPGVNVPYESL